LSRVHPLDQVVQLSGRRVAHRTDHAPTQEGHRVCVTVEASPHPTALAPNGTRFCIFFDPPCRPFSPDRVEGRQSATGTNQSPAISPGTLVIGDRLLWSTRSRPSPGCAPVSPLVLLKREMLTWLPLPGACGSARQRRLPPGRGARRPARERGPRCVWKRWKTV